jgi:hypothetical protein
MNRLCTEQYALSYCNCCSASDNAQGNKEQRGPAEEGSQQGKMATDCLARSEEPSSLVQGFSLKEKEAVSALKALQQ